MKLGPKNISFVSQQWEPCVLFCDISLAIANKALNVAVVREFL